MIQHAGLASADTRRPGVFLSSKYEYEMHALPAAPADDSISTLEI
jgi:hypothetical protein